MLLLIKHLKTVLIGDLCNAFQSSVGIIIMTYRACLDQLLDAAKEKSDAILAAAMGPEPHNDRIINGMQAEWDKAENAYASHLDFMRFNRINIDDEMPG